MRVWGRCGWSSNPSRLRREDRSYQWILRIYINDLQSNFLILDILIPYYIAFLTQQPFNIINICSFQLPFSD